MSWFRCLFLWLACFTVMADAAEPVRVRLGGYEFPPYLNLDEHGQPSGILIELLPLLNELQTRFEFVFAETSSKRRYLDFESGQYDAILFEDLNWEWEKYPHQKTHPILTDTEVLVAMRSPDRDASFFKNLQNRKLVGILGYHYQFAQQNTDERELAEKFNILLSNDNLRNIRLIMINRPALAEIAIVTHSYLELYLQRYPEHREKLMISAPEQTYTLRGIVRPEGAISDEQLQALLDQLQAKGKLSALLQRYGLETAAQYSSNP